MSKAATIVTRVIADISGFRKGLEGATKTLHDKTKAVRVGIGKLAKYTAAAAAAGAALAIGLIKQGLSSVDALAKQARAAGGSIDALQGLERAAKDAGLAEGVAAKEALNLNRALGEARRGTGMAAQELRRLGLDAEKLSRLDTDEKMASIADAMRDQGYSADQTQIALRNLGIRNKEMVLLFGEGGDAIREATEEMKALGLSVSDIDAAKIEQANDAFSRIKDVIKGIANTIAIYAAPYVKALAERFTDAAKESGGFGSAIERAFTLLIKGVGYAGNAFYALRVAFKVIELGFHAVQKGIITGLSAIPRAIADTVNKAIETINWLTTQANKLLPEAMQFGQISRYRDRMLDTLDTMAAQTERTMERIKAELHDLALEDMPLDNLERWAEGVRETAQRSAEAQVAAQRDASLRTGEIIDEEARRRAQREAEEAARALQRQRDAAQRQLDSVVAYLRTEEEAINHAYEQRMAALDEARQLDLIGTDAHTEQMLRLWEDYQRQLSGLTKEGEEERAKIQKIQRDNTAGYVASSLQAIGRILDSENRKQFEIQKKLATSAAVVAGIQSIAQTWAAYGFTPQGIAGAAAAALNAAANVAAIQRQSYGGGGTGAPTQTTTAPTAAAAPAGGLLTVQGLSASSLFTGDVVEDLLDRISEHSRQGGRVVFQS